MQLIENQGAISRLFQWNYLLYLSIYYYYYLYLPRQNTLLPFRAIFPKAITWVPDNIF